MSGSRPFKNVKVCWRFTNFIRIARCLAVTRMLKIAQKVSSVEDAEAIRLDGVKMINFDQFKILVCSGNWAGVYAMLEEARSRAVTDDDVSDEVYWRAVALTRQGRYEEALQHLRANANLFNSQCLAQKELASILVKLGRNEEALEELSKAPIEEEMKPFRALALDTKFLYFYLLAKKGNQSIKARLSEIPDDYRHFTLDRKFLTKPDIVALLEHA